MPQNITLLGIESALFRAGETALLLNDGSKKIRRRAQRVLQTIVLPRLNELASAEEEQFTIDTGELSGFSDGENCFYRFISDYKELVKTGKFKDANKLAREYLLEVRRGYTPLG